jgi:hypothetical protein
MLRERRQSSPPPKVEQPRLEPDYQPEKRLKEQPSISLAEQLDLIRQQLGRQVAEQVRS